MSKLTDLEIRKEISIILLNEQFPKAKSIEFDERQNCFWVETVGFSSWPLLDPLTDDALNHQLMIKYKIDVLNPCKFVNAYVCFKSGNAAKIKATDKNLNKAICLAIIEANKDIN